MSCIRAFGTEERTAEGINLSVALDLLIARLQQYQVVPEYVWIFIIMSLALCYYLQKNEVTIIFTFI